MGGSDWTGPGSASPGWRLAPAAQAWHREALRDVHLHLRQHAKQTRHPDPRQRHSLVNEWGKHQLSMGCQRKMTNSLTKPPHDRYGWTWSQEVAVGHCSCNSIFSLHRDDGCTSVSKAKRYVEVLKMIKKKQNVTLCLMKTIFLVAGRTDMKTKIWQCIPTWGGTSMRGRQRSQRAPDFGN